MTDEQIIQNISAGAAKMNKAVRWIYQESGWKEQIKARLKKQGASDMESEDIFQEAICALVFNIRDNKFRGESKLTTYLSSISTKRWFTFRQKTQRAIDKGGNVMGDPADHTTTTPEEEILCQEERMHLDLALDTMGDKCKKVLKLWALNYSMQEIAQQMNYKSAGMARKKKHECLKRLQEKLIADPYFKQ